MPEYEPTSPMSVQNLAEYDVKSSDEDLAPVMNLVAQDERLSRAVIEINEDIVRLVAQFGSNPRAYKRERTRSMRNIVSDIRRSPRHPSIENASQRAHCVREDEEAES